MESSIVIPIGDQRIYGMLHLPSQFSGGKLPTVVICHGFVSNKVGQHRIFVKTARALCQRGYAVARFDYCGCGESSGGHQDVTLARQVEETVKVLDFLAAYPDLDSDNYILLGHSFGGCVAAIVAGRDRRVGKLVLWSPVANPLMEIVEIVGQGLYQKSLAGEQVDYQGFELGREFFLSLSQISPLQEVKDYFGDVFIVHGTADVETPVENARAYEHTLGNRPLGTQTVYLVDGADHTYSSPCWEHAAIRATSKWLGCANNSCGGEKLLTGLGICDIK